MKKLRFWISLWGGKFFLALFKATGNRRDDRPGSAAMHLYHKFLTYVRKPALTIVVTGTNGKTSISSMATDFFTLRGKKVAYNDWGANHYAGMARLLLDAVNIFNRSTKDIAVIESDELISPNSMPQLKPQFILVNNLARDSMIRNAHPGYIFDHLKKALELTPDATVILNADDPLSCFMGEGNRRVYFAVEDLGIESGKSILDDFAVCPQCGGKTAYAYRNYRHIGAFFCPECGMKAPAPDYIGKNAGNGTVTVREADGSETAYPLASDSVHNIYNTVALIALLRAQGIAAAEIAEGLKSIKLPVSREMGECVNGIELKTQVCKGQNATAASTVFRQLGLDPREKEIIMIVDEVFENPGKVETVAWIHDSDYEYLNSPHIHRIIVGGARYLDHRLRLLLAGVPEEKIVCIPEMSETPQHLRFDGDDAVFILHDVTSVSRGRAIFEAVKKRILEEGRMRK